MGTERILSQRKALCCSERLFENFLSLFEIMFVYLYKL